MADISSNHYVPVIKSASLLDSSPADKFTLDDVTDFLTKDSDIQSHYGVVVANDTLHLLFNLNAWGLIQDKHKTHTRRLLFGLPAVESSLTITKAGWWFVPEDTSLDEYDQIIDHFIIDNPAILDKVVANPKSINSVFGQVRKQLKGSIDNKVLMDRFKIKFTR